MGLAGNRQVDQALSNQFRDGSPSLEGGLRLVMPLGNSEGKARYERRRIEVRQLTNQLRSTLDTLLLEVQVGVREVNVTYREVVANYQAVRAAQADLDSKQQRMVLVGVGTDGGANRLNDLLDAQLRLAIADAELLGSVVNYNVALVNLDRVMGALLQARDISVKRTQDEDFLPSLELRPAAPNARSS